MYHNNGMLLHTMGVRVLLVHLVPRHSVVLVITLYLFCRNEGWLLHTRILSCEGYAFFQVHKNLK